MDEITLGVEILPVLNIMLGLAGFIWLLMRSERRWSEYPIEVKWLITTLGAFIFCLIMVSGEQIIAHTMINWTAALITAVKILLHVMLVKTRHTKYRTGTRTDNGNLGDDPNRNVQGFDGESGEPPLVTAPGRALRGRGRRQ